jgi:hypothetical protein
VQCAGLAEELLTNVQTTGGASSVCLRLGDKSASLVRMLTQLQEEATHLWRVWQQADRLKRRAASDGVHDMSQQPVANDDEYPSLKRLKCESDISPTENEPSSLYASSWSDNGLDCKPVYQDCDIIPPVDQQRTQASQSSRHSFQDVSNVQRCSTNVDSDRKPVQWSQHCLSQVTQDAYNQGNDESTNNENEANSEEDVYMPSSQPLSGRMLQHSGSSLIRSRLTVLASPIKKAVQRVGEHQAARLGASRPGRPGSSQLSRPGGSHSNIPAAARPGQSDGAPQSHQNRSGGASGNQRSHM